MSNLENIFNTTLKISVKARVFEGFQVDIEPCQSLESRHNNHGEKRPFLRKEDKI